MPLAVRALTLAIPSLPSKGVCVVQVLFGESLTDHPRTGTAARRPGAGTGGPPIGNTGGKSPIQCDARAISIHWLRVTHPGSRRYELRDRLVELFGEPDECRGRWFYERGERFANGVLLLWGGASNARVGGEVAADGDGEEPGGDGTCCVDVPGSAIDAIEPGERFGVCVELSLGGRVSRFDVAADAWHSERVGLIAAILDACARGELCGSRSWEPRVSYRGLDRVAWGVNLGLRGKKGSGRYVRVYDKGLESGELPEGRWERFEVEFTGDCAAEVASDVLSGGGDWESRAWGRVNGAVSFREVGASNGELARRPLVSWWARWVSGSVPVSTVMKRAVTTLERHAEWLAATVLPTVARLGREAGVPFTDVLYVLTRGQVRVRRTDKQMRTMLADWRRLVRGRVLAVA